jgi:predicted TIM-barrel fold metal-dependent hydrolase
MSKPNPFMYLRSLASCLLAVGMLQWPHASVADDGASPIGEAVNALPLFDAHMHYKRDAWEPFPPDRVLSLMDRNGVAMALVSSSPDDGTITLWEYAPQRIVPEMRPYNERVGPGNWTRSEGVGDIIEQRVRQYPHQGIGEFHLHRIDPQDEPLLRRIVALAMDKKIPLHVHSDHEPIEFLYSLNPGLTIIWAHAGMSEPPAVIETMMARYPSLYADTSYREMDILNHGSRIDETWRQLLERFADRFMLGSDTWTNSQWLDYDSLMAINRRWLSQLSAPSAKKIAHANAERLFSRKIDSDLLGER